MVKYLNLKVNT